ncbi:hypothetical protein I7I48_03538 [Histoplasma ohiense]|nr:hypothetical protein I7I48_03538 [Histoplasma ohiense (nom. inval.)]
MGGLEPVPSKAVKGFFEKIFSFLSAGFQTHQGDNRTARYNNAPRLVYQFGPKSKQLVPIRIRICSFQSTDVGTQMDNTDGVIRKSQRHLTSSKHVSSWKCSLKRISYQMDTPRNMNNFVSHDTSLDYGQPSPITNSPLHFVMNTSSTLA